MNKFFSKICEKGNIPKIRLIVQSGFLLFIGYAVLLFAKFMSAVAVGTADIAMRPGAVDGFLPIAGFVSFVHWLLSGEYDIYHPAALTIFTAILITGFIFRKGFCSWLCPVGTLFEWCGKIGEKLFKRRVQLPKFLDYPLMALKYLLLIFFAYFAFTMTEVALQISQFSDVGLYKYWFIDGPGIIFIVGLAIIIILSMLIRNFWCRYLCPYGAILGLVAIISPMAVNRDEQKCINCGKCTKACPNNIKVAEKSRVNSPECISCMTCIKECPVEGALNYKVVGLKKAIPLWIYPVAILLVFILVTEIAKMTGHWQTVLTVSQYLQSLGQI